MGMLRDGETGTLMWDSHFVSSCFPSCGHLYLMETPFSDPKSSVLPGAQFIGIEIGRDLIWSDYVPGFSGPCSEMETRPLTPVDGHPTTVLREK